MKSFLRFVSLTTATQICLLINQLVLLPLQLRIWGQDATSQWFVVTAIANLATVADLGLRSAGHAQLIAGVRDGNALALAQFRGIWALARMFIFGSTILLLLGDAITGLEGEDVPVWVAAVIISVGLDTLIIVRGMWLDSLGHFNKVELLFLAMVSSRLLLSIIGLNEFAAPPALLACIMLVTAIGGSILQACFLRSPPALALLAGGFDALRWRTVGVVRFVVAEPASNWVRLSLPVIVFAAISSPRFVTIYVALRAVFGLARQVTNQISRYASVSYLRSLDERPSSAERILSRSVLAITLTGLGVSSAVIIDHGRLLRFWLREGEPHSEGLIALSFAVGAIAYAYQVFASVMMRRGDVEAVAKRQYLYLAMSGLAAAVGYQVGWVLLYLLLLPLPEILIAGLFVTAFRRSFVRLSLAILATATVLFLALWVAADRNLGDMFGAMTVPKMTASLFLGLGLATFGSVACILIDRRSSSQR